MIETAFVIGLLVLLIFGMTEFGRAMYTKNTLNNAARAGARAAVVTTGIEDVNLSKGSWTDNFDCSTYTCPNAGNPEECVYKAVCSSIVAAIPKSKVSVNVDVLGKSGGASAATGDTITVTVQADFDPVLNIMKSMIRSTLNGEASMRFE